MGNFSVTHNILECKKQLKFFNLNFIEMNLTIEY